MPGYGRVGRGGSLPALTGHHKFFHRSFNAPKPYAAAPNRQIRLCYKGVYLSGLYRSEFQG
jgi:hypothetical protein